MIFDHSDNYKQYGLNGIKWKKAFSFLATLNAGTPVGEYPIMGDDVYCRVFTYETRSPDEGRIESHCEYIDIQICLSGAEGIDLFDSDKLEKIVEYDSESDLIFYKDQEARKVSRVDIWPGYFICLWPRDAHRPQMIVDDKIARIKKAVVKVKV